jgi:hypothetical protein
MATKKATRKTKARRAITKTSATKARRTTTQTAARKAAPEQPNPGSTGPRQVRSDLVNSVLEEARGIIGKVIEQAKKGNYLPAKYLFEFAGIAEPLPESDVEPAAPHPSLAEILLATLHGDPVTRIEGPHTERPPVG